MQGQTLEAAAAAAGMSERSASTWQDGPMPSATTTSRTWRTRPDPFAAVWATEIEPYLRSDEDGELLATTLMDELCRRHPTEFEPGPGAHAAAADPTLARAARSPAGGVVSAGASAGSPRRVRLHPLRRARRDDRRRALRAPDVPVRAGVERLALHLDRDGRDLRGARVGAPGRVLGARRGARARAAGQSVGGDARARRDQRPGVDQALRPGRRPLRLRALTRSSPARRTRMASSRRPTTCSRPP